jgi:SOS-response transcriptional repressor LexA
MTGDDIHEGDIALIRQQPTVEDGEIAAIVIKTPELESLGVLKRFRFTLMKRQELQHWLLESSNPSSEHLVVMPEGADVKTIKNLYAKGKWTDKVKFYENAEALVAGKYIGSVKSNQ